MSADYLPNLIAKIRPRLEEVGDCLEWQGAMAASGSSRNRTQPIISAGCHGKTYTVKLPVRRLLWEAEHGPIPPGRLVIPSCGNDRCCGHLKLAVRGEQIRNRARLGQMRHSPAAIAALTRGARNRATARYSIEHARAVRDLAAHGVPDVLISWATDVHLDCVGDMRRGDTWKEQTAVASVFSWRPA